MTSTPTPSGRLVLCPNCLWENRDYLAASENDAGGEGYPGIAHDFETMRGLLRGVENLLHRCLRHGLLRAEAEAMLRDIEQITRPAGESADAQASGMESRAAAPGALQPSGQGRGAGSDHLKAATTPPVAASSEANSPVSLAIAERVYREDAALSSTVDKPTPATFDEIAAGDVHRPPFAAEFIKGHGTFGSHYRIHDANDNALCFCYSDGNAQEVVRRLNTANSATRTTTIIEALDRMIKSCESDISIEAGNHATVGFLQGELKGLKAAWFMLARPDSRGDHG